jgi:AraC family transcriptional regulator, activator of mtrCDE
MRCDFFSLFFSVPAYGAGSACRGALHDHRRWPCCLHGGKRKPRRSRRLRHHLGTYGGALGLFDHLQEPLAEDLSQEKLVRTAFELLSAEIAKPSVGTHALAESLMKQCLILLLRRHLFRRNIRSPLFAALQDQRLARAIIEILERPAARHTVDSLAARAGMSRSSFTERFNEAFGEPPIEFVQRIRLRLGAQLLSTTDLPIKVIANSVGYSSRSYFSSAFRAAYGADPSAFRAFGGYAEQEPIPIERRGTATQAIKDSEKQS